MLQGYAEQTTDSSLLCVLKHVLSKTLLFTPSYMLHML